MQRSRFSRSHGATPSSVGRGTFEAEEGGAEAGPEAEAHGDHVRLHPVGRRSSIRRAILLLWTPKNRAAFTREPWRAEGSGQVKASRTVRWTRKDESHRRNRFGLEIETGSTGFDDRFIFPFHRESPPILSQMDTPLLARSASARCSDPTEVSGPDFHGHVVLFPMAGSHFLWFDAHQYVGV